MIITIFLNNFLHLSLSTYELSWNKPSDLDDCHQDSNHHPTASYSNTTASTFLTRNHDTSDPAHKTQPQPRSSQVKSHLNSSKTSLPYFPIPVPHENSTFKESGSQLPALSS